MLYSEEQDCYTVKIKINVEQMLIADDYSEKAFMFLVEKCEEFLRHEKDYGMLIGDRENRKVAKKFSEMLSGYRNNGTPYELGKDSLEYLIDTVHFSNSEHSRLLQLADFYVWSLSFLNHCDERKTANKDLKKRIKRSWPQQCGPLTRQTPKSKIPFPTKRKDWPSANSNLSRQVKKLD